MALADTYADLDGHIEGLYRGQLVAESDVRRLCEKVKEILQAESNVVPVRAPVTVVRPPPRRHFTHSPRRPGWFPGPCCPLSCLVCGKGCLEVCPLHVWLTPAPQTRALPLPPGG
jgi:hypothetical protein